MNDLFFRKIENLYNIVLDDLNKGYDVRQVIYEIVDCDENGNLDFFEIFLYFVLNVVVGFGRMNGQIVGIVVNNLIYFVGVFDIDSLDKIVCFVRICDVFNILIVIFVDVLGYLFGIDQEYCGIIRYGVKVFYVYVEVIVLMVIVILRKVYGGVYFVMGSKYFGVDFVFVWLIVEIVVMGFEGVVNIIFRKEIVVVENLEEVRQQKIQEYCEKFVNLYVVVVCGYIDDVIDLVEIRVKIILVFEVMESKRVKFLLKKYGNILL